MSGGGDETDKVIIAGDDNDNSMKFEENPPNFKLFTDDLTDKGSINDKKKRTAIACTHCRQRHIKCDGMGEPCSRCLHLGYDCVYSEAERKVVISVKYLDKLQNQISILKKENANLRSLNKYEKDGNSININTNTNTNANTNTNTNANININDNDNSSGNSNNNIVIENTTTTNTINNSVRNGSIQPELDRGKTSNEDIEPLETFNENIKLNSSKNIRIISKSEEDKVNNKFPKKSDLNQSNNSESIDNSNINEKKNQEVIPPFLENYGRLIHSRTGERLYIGSSNMTLFGLEIDRLVAPMLPKNQQTSPDSATTPTNNVETETILEKEGNAYRIMLGKTHSRPGINVNFTLPSYSYAMLLVDSFVSYNDGCFYFFNEGLVKENLRRIYNDEKNTGFKLDYGIESLNISPQNDSTLETIWFCKLLLIFATGEMYLGTANYLNGYKLNEKPRRKKQKINRQKVSSSTKTSNMNQPFSTIPSLSQENTNDQESINPDNINNNNNSRKRSKQSYNGTKLPGSGFFNQASELFTGLFASGSIDNCIREGGIEVLLLYAFYLQVADCTAASYFYFGIALRASLLLGLHVDVGKDTLNRFELEHRRRLWWTVYMYERMLASKAGLPLSLTDEDISTELPNDFDMSNPNAGCENYIFPEAEFISNCVKITQINANILRKLYTRQPSSNILPVVHEMVVALLKWKKSLPNDINCDYSQPELSISRLVVNMMTEYFQGVNLAVRPLLFHFVLFNLKSSNPREGKYLDLSKYSSVVLALLNASFQASINTIRSLWALVPENMVAMFGYMDREYLFNATATLVLFNATFGVYDATNEHLDHALILFTKMRNLGNHPATLRREQILRLLSILDFTGSMSHLIKKHNDNLNAPASSANSDKSFGHVVSVSTNEDKQSTISQTNTSNNLLSNIKESNTPVSNIEKKSSKTDTFKLPNETFSNSLLNSVNANKSLSMEPPSLDSMDIHLQTHLHSDHDNSQLHSQSNFSTVHSGLNHISPANNQHHQNSQQTASPLFIESLTSMLEKTKPQQEVNIGLFSPSLTSIFNQIDDIPEFTQLSTTNDIELWKDVTNQAAWLQNDMGDEFGNLLDHNDKN